MLKRILMNQADASPGNGAPATTPAAVQPAQDPPPANGAPTPNPLEEMVAKLTTTVETLSKSVNSLHASDRRAREGKLPAKSDDKEGTTPTADDPSSLLALRDAFDDSTAELKLTKGQRQLLREHVMAKRPHPSDVDGFVTDYVSRAGWTAPQNPAAPVAAQTVAPQPKPQQNAQPVSDRGAPPPSQVPAHEADLVTMSESDRAHLIKEKGLAWYRQQLGKQLKGRSLRLR